MSHIRLAKQVFEASPLDVLSHVCDIYGFAKSAAHGCPHTYSCFKAISDHAFRTLFLFPLI